MSRRCWTVALSFLAVLIVVSPFSAHYFLSRRKKQQLESKNDFEIEKESNQIRESKNSEEFFFTPCSELINTNEKICSQDIFCAPERSEIKHIGSKIMNMNGIIKNIFFLKKYNLDIHYTIPLQSYISNFTKLNHFKYFFEQDYDSSHSNAQKIFAYFERLCEILVLVYSPTKKLFLSGQMQCLKKLLFGKQYNERGLHDVKQIISSTSIFSNTQTKSSIFYNLNTPSENIYLAELFLCLLCEMEFKLNFLIDNDFLEESFSNSLKPISLITYEGVEKILDVLIQYFGDFSPIRTHFLRILKLFLPSMMKNFYTSNLRSNALNKFFTQLKNLTEYILEMDYVSNENESTKIDEKDLYQNLELFLFKAHIEF